MPREAEDGIMPELAPTNCRCMNSDVSGFTHDGAVLLLVFSSVFWPANYGKHLFVFHQGDTF